LKSSNGGYLIARRELLLRETLRAKRDKAEAKEGLAVEDSYLFDGSQIQRWERKPADIAVSIVKQN